MFDLNIRRLLVLQEQIMACSKRHHLTEIIVVEKNIKIDQLKNFADFGRKKRKNHNFRPKSANFF